ncbi:hypothetical protein [Moorena sp. SIO3E8]|uniref:hypothetical protein n=1 Tax=Moorena sp. SIO3E8 TaxID=2607830 RepID=UPI0025E48B59|nr:hypothetical protein [Moorena sp. SIO3E8]
MGAVGALGRWGDGESDLRMAFHGTYKVPTQVTHKEPKPLALCINTMYLKILLSLENYFIPLPTLPHLPTIFPLFPIPYST